MNAGFVMGAFGVATERRPRPSRTISLALGLAKTTAKLYRTGRVAPVYGAPNCAQEPVF